MKVFVALFVFTLLLVACASQQAGPGMAAGTQPNSNMLQLLMFRSLFDMNWLQSMALSGSLGGGGGGMGGLLPWFYLAN